MYRYSKVSITFVVIIKELFWFRIRKQEYIVNIPSMTPGPRHEKFHLQFDGASRMFDISQVTQLVAHLKER